jgi:glycerol-3-phosphate responsive antiterminator
VKQIHVHTSRERDKNIQKQYIIDVHAITGASGKDVTPFSFLKHKSEGDGIIFVKGFPLYIF